MTSESPRHLGSPSPAPFAGEVVAFTGKLASVGRREARALVERLGGGVVSDVTARTTMLVVGAELASGRSLKILKAREVNARVPGAVTIVTEEQFCRRGGVWSNESLQRRYHGLRQLRRRYPLVRDHRLRHLQRRGLIRPVVRTNVDTYYEFRDVAVVKRVHRDLEHGVSFRRAIRGLLTERDGQLALDFEAVRADTRPAKVIALKYPTTETPHGPLGDPEGPAGLAARLFLEGAELDEGAGADPERAQVLYRKALMVDPTLVPALVNLANVHYAQDALVEAQALYERALRIDAECFEASFNLGNIHHDLGQYHTAVTCYRDALSKQDRYADAHFYLAVTLEKLGQSSAAKPHWRAYLALEPAGEWADLAREFSE